ncbi:MAG: YajQ family cyclic di-GMP-binding protein [Candidatus Omnitrophica bacterium]|nr:YajQ family cyclic di-GMP-binding protein [Candidatus Omnitrophota bacterium]
MAQEHSFDVVSKVNLQELRNAIAQAQKELATRFDFRGSQASVAYEESDGALKVTADHQAQLRSVVDVVETKLAKRGVPLKAFVWGQPEPLPSGSMKQQARLQQGLSSEQAKAITKTVKDLGIKVQPRIDGDAVRVSGKQLDELQAVMQSLRGKDFGAPLQFENYR